MESQQVNQGDESHPSQSMMLLYTKYITKIHNAIYLYTSRSKIRKDFGPRYARLLPSSLSCSSAQRYDHPFSLAASFKYGNNVLAESVIIMMVPAGAIVSMSP